MGEPRMLSDVLREPNAVSVAQVARQLDALERACREGPVTDEYRGLTVTLVVERAE